MQFGQSAAIEERESQTITIDNDSYRTLFTSISVDFLIRKYDTALQIKTSSFQNV